MEEKEHKGLTPGDNNKSEENTGNLLNKQNVQVPSSLLPSVLQRLGLAEEVSTPEIAVDTLVEQLYSQDWEERLNAVRALSRLGDSVPVELLTTVVDDEDASVRAVALFALGNAGRRAPLHLLVAALSDRDWHVREVGVLALGKQGERVPQEVLRTALHDSDYAVREAARIALQGHTATTELSEFLDLENPAVSEGQRWEHYIMQQKERHQNGHKDEMLLGEDWKDASSLVYSSDISRPQHVLHEQQQAYAAQGSLPEKGWQSYTPQEPESGGQMQMFAPLESSSGEQTQRERQQEPEPVYEEYHQEPSMSGEKVTSLPRQRRRGLTGWWILLIVMGALLLLLLGGTIMRSGRPAVGIDGPGVAQSQKVFSGPDTGASVNTFTLNPKSAAQARQAIADGLNLSPDDITQRLKEGQSMQDIAAAQGISADQLHAIEMKAITNLFNTQKKSDNMKDSDGQGMLQGLQDNPEALDKLTESLFMAPPEAPEKPAQP